MNRQQDPDTDFEARLLARLREIVVQRGAIEASSQTTGAGDTTPAWRRGPRLALGGVLALAAVAAALVVSAGGDNPPAAFAVEPQEGGGVTIRIYSLSDPSGVEDALGAAGISSQVTYLPAGITCREPHYKPSVALVPQPGGRVTPQSGSNMWSPDDPMTIGIGDLQQRRILHKGFMRGDPSAAEGPNLLVDPASFRPDQTLILWASPAPHDGDPEWASVSYVRIAEGRVGPCEPVPAPWPEGQAPFRAPAGGWGCHIPKHWHKGCPPL